MTDRSCRTCAYLAVPLDKAGRAIPRKDHLYRCKFPVPDITAQLPLSITEAHGWRQPADRTKRLVSPDDTGCPVHVPKKGKSDA